jgi:hypothetical protein
MKKIKCSALGRNVFLGSFLTGTFLLVMFLITKADLLTILGFYFVIAAAVVNIIVLLYELLVFLTDASNHKPSGNSVLLLLLNIPVTLLYLFIVYYMNV